MLAGIGEVLAEYHYQSARRLMAERIQCDEVWAFVRAEPKNVPKEHEGIFGVGDVWTWVGIDAHTKLLASWMVGGRDLQVSPFLARRGILRIASGGGWGMGMRRRMPGSRMAAGLTEAQG